MTSTAEPRAVDRKPRLDGTTLLAIGPREAALLANVCGIVLAWVAVGVVTQRGWPLAPALITLVYVVVFFALLARDGRSPERMARWRVAHLWTAAAMGTLLSCFWITDAVVQAQRVSPRSDNRKGVWSACTLTTADDPLCG